MLQCRDQMQGQLQGLVSRALILPVPVQVLLALGLRVNKRRRQLVTGLPVRSQATLQVQELALALALV